MSLARINAGKKGEHLALYFLKKNGYEIIEKNYKTKYGEIDIIGKDGGFISFIEVRSRNTGRFGLPEYSIRRRKQDKIAKAALLYIKKKHLEENCCRFDVVCVDEVTSPSPKTRLIKNAFELAARYTY